jgi:Tol biopolymer transport system component
MGADLWVINSDGSDMRRVFSPEHEDEFVLYPSWSPDGNVIAFVYVSREGTSVWVVNEDGTNPRQLVESAYRPKWSPKGDEIAIMKMWGKVPFVGGDSSFIVSISF